jgi:hypothetical protein
MLPAGAVQKTGWPGNMGKAYTAWCGYAFENICFAHILQIKQALQIAGVQSEQYSWFKPGSATEDGAQIDLLIDRADNCINVCEIKFAATPFAIDKKYAETLQSRLMLFKQQVPARKKLLLTFIITYGLADNEYKQQLADNELGMEVLFG